MISATHQTLHCMPIHIPARQCVCSQSFHLFCFFLELFEFVQVEDSIFCCCCGIFFFAIIAVGVKASSSPSYLLVLIHDSVVTMLIAGILFILSLRHHGKIQSVLCIVLVWVEKMTDFEMYQVSQGTQVLVGGKFDMFLNGQVGIKFQPTKIRRAIISIETKPTTPK